MSSQRQIETAWRDRRCQPVTVSWTAIMQKSMVSICRFAASIRGGSWHSPISDITTTARGRGGFALQTHGTGFRCARGLEDRTQHK